MKTRLCAWLAMLTMGVVLVFSPGCHCRKKTDEQLLKERLDTTYVHLYLASKIALTEKSAEATKARGALVKLMQVTQDPSSAHELSPADASALALALWDLRGVGKEAFERGRKDYPDPVLPALVGEPEATTLGRVLDANTEHGVLLFAFTLLKMHPDSPVPVPPELLLYEAWALEPDTMKLESLGPAMHGVKAYTFATNELCDLSSIEAEKIPTEGSIVDRKALRADLKRLLGTDVKLDDDQTEDIDGAVRTLSNGALALCYVKRDELDKATPALRRFVDGAEKLGVRGKEMDALRAYLDCGGGEKCKGRIDRTTLAYLTAKVAYEQLDRSGILDALADNAAVSAIRRYTLVIADTLGAAKDVIPSFSSVKDKATSWWPPW